MALLHIDCIIHILMQPTFNGYSMFNPAFPCFILQNPVLPGTFFPIPYGQPPIIYPGLHFAIENQSSLDLQEINHNVFDSLESKRIVETRQQQQKPLKLRQMPQKTREFQGYYERESKQIDSKAKSEITVKKSNRGYASKVDQIRQETPSQKHTLKNIESNIVNQVFSFLWNQPKNRQYVNKYFQGNKQKFILFFEYFKVIRRCNKRQLNKIYLKHLCDFKPGHLAYAKIAKQQHRLEYLSIEQFSHCVRFLTRIFLSKFCPLSIVTSRKMKKQVWRQHLKKARQVFAYIFHGQEIQPQSQDDQLKNEGEFIINKFQQS